MQKCCGCLCVTPEPAGGVWYPAVPASSVSGGCNGSCGCGDSTSECCDCCVGRLDGLVGGFTPDDIVGMTFNGVDVKSLYYGGGSIWDDTDEELSVSTKKVALLADGSPLVVQVFSNSDWKVVND